MGTHVPGYIGVGETGVAPEETQLSPRCARCGLPFPAQKETRNKGNKKQKHPTPHPYPSPDGCAATADPWRSSSWAEISTRIRSASATRYSGNHPVSSNRLAICMAPELPSARWTSAGPGRPRPRNGVDLSSVHSVNRCSTVCGPTPHGVTRNTPGRERTFCLGVFDSFLVEFDGLTVGSRTMVCFTWHVSRHVVCSLFCESKHALSWAMDIRRIHSHR